MEGTITSDHQSKRKAVVMSDEGFIDTIFSWSLGDIYNENLFQVEMIPESFASVRQYFNSYVIPLLEETRARLHQSIEIISKAPFAEVVKLSPCRPHGTLVYDVKIDYWRNRFSDIGKDPYKTLPGDIVVLADAKPEIASDLQMRGRTWNLAVVTNITDDESEEDANTSTHFKVQAPTNIDSGDAVHKLMFVIFVTNITTNKRIWKALHMSGNLNIINKVLCKNSLFEGDCDVCSLRSDGTWDDNFVGDLMSKLNESQTEAVLECLCKIQCKHMSSVELIWGPPGTGKTKTVSLLLMTLLRLKCRTLMCAPTNTAIKEVALRVLKLKAESIEEICTLADILLIGNKDRLKVSSEIEEIYLDYRVERIAECFAPSTGWWHCIASLIEFFEDCACEYNVLLENKLIKEQELDNGEENREETCSGKTDACNIEHKSFLDYARDRFLITVEQLKRCICILCTHVTEDYILKHNLEMLKLTVGLLESFQMLLCDHEIDPEGVQKVFSKDSSEVFTGILLELHLQRMQCLSALKALRISLKENLPRAMNKTNIEELCFQTASLIFCTASSSYKLYNIDMEPLKMLVIDEASQLKECESAIPLQLPGIRHAILVGDECQLPAVVESNQSDKAGFGRSLFQRLSLLEYPKHLLNMQYRMHPAISYFPNLKFYFNQIRDAPNVRSRFYEKRFLLGQMFGPYSFINVSYGREEFDDVGRSRRNMVEVAVVLKLVQKLYKEWKGSKSQLSVGVISPYTAQVVAIQEKLGKRYENDGGFSVKVKTVDGFQGGEEDVIIITTVRANKRSAIGFVSNHQRVNVSLTRARHCLWILGNEATLASKDSIWEILVRDVKNRQCFFNADEDKDLAKAIIDVKKELNQLDDLLNGDSSLFKDARWKVLFSEYFIRSFVKLPSMQTKTSVLNLLLKLSSGWRPKNLNVDLTCGSSSQHLKKFKVEGLYIICSIDIAKEVKYTQVLKVWDILSLEDIPRLIKRLGGIFETHTEDFINRCNEKCFEGDLEVPKTWSTTFEIIRYRSLDNSKAGSDSTLSASNVECYVENSKVSDSLLLMKFYSLSSGVVRHLLSDRDGRELELPFEVTEEELEIILFPRSTFILGRSGTGKTTVLTMKLYQKEQQFHMATEGFGKDTGNISKDTFCRKSTDDDVKDDEKGVGEAEKNVLRQLFVTVSPRLCHAVKHHVSRLKSFASGGKFSAKSSSVDMDDIDDAAQFKDVQDSFVDIPPSSYPLVVTFSKFLMMLDGTMSYSYFERFSDTRQFSHGEVGNLGAIAIQTFIKTQEVNYDRFCSTYWPHFNTKMTKNLDSSRVFTEIMSHIKGGSQAGQTCDGRLPREDYVKLSEARISTLTAEKREMIYDIFEDYEKMKVENGDFDMADFVIDLHIRLKNEKYKGQLMDFVYIDEVQDLTMRQISLFKYICRHVNEGFVFSGDTAQTIARGIDFRFEDIRSLFYNDFVLVSRYEGNDRRKEKGQISKIFNLSHNFRTHAGILKIAQSVIDLLYRFFPSFVDVLTPESSHIYGEAPILLEAGDDENAIVTIFGNTGNERGNFVGFGAEQVILVRDDSARKEIYNCVGKQALVLTVVECKGLEFQDVLLYNFFSTSPFKNKWRVVYEYMKEQDLLDANSSKSFPSFNISKHNVLCSELKQLYVAITRTRQRLWICENLEEFSKPMFDYWKRKGIVQVRRLDDSLAQAMQVASSPEEWKSRGYKLLREGNYEMATMCFERAGDEHGEKLAKAAGLRASADRMHVSNPEMASVARRQAAEIFESIGKADQAAECFYMLKDYERAGKIYQQCDSMEKAGECFCLAGCYERAAEVYAKINHFSKCLSTCTQGKLFDMGLKYIQCWKHDATASNYSGKRGKEIEKVEQEFLENCAFHYHELNDVKSMMKYVKAFDTMDSIRTFLNTLGCLDELLALEQEQNNFVEAAKIAKLKGELLLEAEMLGKAEKFKEASMLILCYVLANSLWSGGSRGWPLKQFLQKEEILERAKSFARNESPQFYELVCMEANILLNDQSNLFLMKRHLDDSLRHKSIRGEILSARKILDAHFSMNIPKYVWNNDLVLDLERLVDDNMSKNQASVETLIYFWTSWKDKIVNIVVHLEHLGMQIMNEHVSSDEFCLSYFGVRRQFSNLGATYLLMNSDAEWVRDVDSSYLRKNGKLVSIDFHQFVFASRSYWCSELLSVGKRVLNILEALYNFSVRNSSSFFCQSSSLTQIYEVAKFLLDSKFLDQSHRNNKDLWKFIKMSTENLFDCIHPLDWREALRQNMIAFRRTGTCRKLLKEVIVEYLSLNKLSYGQCGKVAIIMLGSGKFYNNLYDDKMAHGLEWNSSWKALFEHLCGNAVPTSSTASNFEVLGELALSKLLHGTLVDTYNANWMKENDYISPGCFLYLVERQLILLGCFQGSFLTTKSSFVEWVIYQEGNSSLTSGSVAGVKESIKSFPNFLIQIVSQLLYEQKDTKEWTRKCYSNVDCLAVLVLRLVVVVCLFYLNFGFGRELLHGLMGRNYITDKLPKDFYSALCKGKRNKFQNLDINAIAEAFKKINNPLVIVSVNQNDPRKSCPDAFYIDMKANRNTDDVLGKLFPLIPEAFEEHKGPVEAGTASSCKVVESPENSNQVKMSELPSPSIGSMEDRNANQNEIGESTLSSTHHQFWEVLVTLKSMNLGRDVDSHVTEDQTVKVDARKVICDLTADVDGCMKKTPRNDESKCFFEEAECMLDELNQLNAALDMSSKGELDGNLPTIGELVDKLQSRKPRMEPFLEKMIASRVNVASATQASNCNNENKAKGSNKSKKNRRGKGGSKRR